MMLVLIVFQRYFNLFIYIYIFIYVVTARLSICFMSNVNKITLTFQNSCSRSFEIFSFNSSNLKYFIINKNYSSLVISFYRNV